MNTNDTMNPKLSQFEGINPHPLQVQPTVEQVFEYIKTDGRLKDDTQNAREALKRDIVTNSRNDKGELRTPEYKALKEKFPGVTWAGTFTKRRNSALIQASRLLSFDIDVDKYQRVIDYEKERCRTQELFTRLSQDKYVAGGEISLSDMGIKGLVRIPLVTNDAEYKAYFRAFQAYLRDTYSVTLDSLPDISRLCFLAFCPDAFWCPEKSVFTQTTTTPKSTQNTYTSYGSKLQAALDILVKTGISETIGRNEFVGLCGAFKHEGIDYEIFDRIMQKTAGYDADENVKIWNSVKDDTHEGSKTTAGTIVNYAKAADPEAYNFVIASAPREPQHPADTDATPGAPPQHPAAQKPRAQEDVTSPKQEEYLVLSEIEKRLAPKVRQALLAKFETLQDVEFDINKQHPILRKYYENVKGSTDAPPQTLITPLLPALACNIGNKANITAFSKNHYCNIWAIIIAPSTIGRKTTSLKLPLNPIEDFNTKLYEEYKVKYAVWKTVEEEKKKKGTEDTEDTKVEEPPRKRLLFPTTTSERLFQILVDNPNGLMVFSEIASFLAKMNKSYNGDFKADITDYFDVPERKEHETMTRSDMIKRPCFSISAATTKEWLLKEMDKESDINSGFMQRFLVCNSHEIDISRLDFSFREGNGTHQYINNYLARIYHGLRQIGTIEHPVKLLLSDEAKSLFERINRSVFQQIEQEQNNILLSYAGRIFTDYFLRLSIIFTLTELVNACLENGWNVQEIVTTDIVVSEETAGFVAELCLFYFANIRQFLKVEISDSRETANEKKIVRVFQREGEKLLQHTYVKNQSGIRNTKDFKIAIENLIEQDVITAHTVRRKEDTRSAVWYKYCL